MTAKRIPLPLSEHSQAGRRDDRLRLSRAWQPAAAMRSRAFARFAIGEDPQSRRGAARRGLKHVADR